MDIRRELDKVIDTKGLTEEQLWKLWRQWKKKKSA
jgi:hypothetical protein